MATLPFAPPIPPMLARLARALPEGDYAYEPKWDGFRCLAFACGGDVDLRSRHERPLARYIGHSPTGRLAGSAGRWDPREMEMDWTALAPVRVAEIAYDRLDDLRFRRPGRFVRWRPDREARSCALDQLAVAPPELDLARGTGT